MTDNESNTKSGASPAKDAGGGVGAGKGRRRKRGASNIVLLLLVIAAVAAFWWAEQQRRTVAQRLEETKAELEEIRQNTQDTGESVANEVLEKLQVLIDIPLEPQPAVATITDVEQLRQANEFFNRAENGDFVILTENRAILYDQERNIILDVAPFTVEPTADTGGGDTTTGGDTTGGDAAGGGAAPAEGGEQPQQ